MALTIAEIVIISLLVDFLFKKMRMPGLIGSDLNLKEKMFVIISYIPKATVQAAIGGAPLIAMKAAGMDTAPGEVILAVAVVSILLTAPLGAIAIMFYGHKVLEIEELQQTN